MSIFQAHPFAVEAFFEYSLVVTYGIPTELAQSLVPYPLIPDTHENTTAFLAAAFVKTKALRPKGFPKCLGRDFFLAGFRVFVRYRTSKGKNLRGLFILRSLTNKSSMAVAGNMLTHYNYKVIDIKEENRPENIRISSKTAGIDVSVSCSQDSPALPSTSPFKDWKEARRFAGPMPFTFTVEPQSRVTMMVEGIRENWTPQPAELLHAECEVLNEFGAEQATPASVFIVRNIPYCWKRGVRDQWPS